ncbi:MAG: hypothetical protein LBU75_15765 [Desulfovibrio sp.]|nr:hypothetical protein [Desulfovibrio sp.]
MARQNVDERRGTAIRHGEDGPFRQNAAGHAHAAQFGGRFQQRGKAVLETGKADMGIHGVPTARRPYPPSSMQDAIRKYDAISPCCENICPSAPRAGPMTRA